MSHSLSTGRTGSVLTFKGGTPAVLTETWYGEGEEWRGKTRLLILLGPEAKFQVFEHRLIFDLVIPVTGKMVLRTERRVIMPEGWDELPVLERPRLPRGQPEVVVDVSYDPSPVDGYGAWRGRKTGRWACRVRAIRKKSVWARIRG